MKSRTFKLGDVAKGIIVPVLVAILVAHLTYLAEAAPPTQSAAEGQALFQQDCAGCHTIGGGKLVGPDLKGVTKRRANEWLTNWISAPDKMLAAKDPTAVQLLQENNNLPMPNLGLAPTQVASLIAYLQEQDGTAATTATTSPQPQGTSAPPATQPPVKPVAAGNPIVGQALFTGAQRFQNGGPPCMGCHSIGGLGALGGGMLGPDLTAAYAKYGGTVGLTSFLNSVPTATMNAVWTRQPLAPQEQANLVAFLQRSSTLGPPVNPVAQIAVVAIAGTVLLLLFTQWYWRKRLVGVRRALVQRARSGSPPPSEER